MAGLLCLKKSLEGGFTPEGSKGHAVLNCGEKRPHRRRARKRAFKKHNHLHVSQLMALASEGRSQLDSKSFSGSSYHGEVQIVAEASPVWWGFLGRFVVSWKT